MQFYLPGFSLAYTDKGEGLPLLLVHGFPLNRQMWAPQVDGLADGARILAPDLRGHGASDSVAGVYPMEQLASDLAQFLHVLEIDRPVVVCGLSMGGYVSLAFYRYFPERVAGLVLAATRAKADSPEARANRLSLAEKARAEGIQPVIAGMLPKMFAPETYIANRPVVEQVQAIMQQTSLEGVVGALLGMRGRADSSDLLRGIDKPTLVIHGAADQIVPPEEAQKMQEAIPGARLELIPNAGHLLNLERPNLFNGALQMFLESIKNTI